MDASYLLMSILLNAQLLLLFVTLLQANIIVTRHVSNLKGKWQQKILSSCLRDSKTIYRSLLQNFYICLIWLDILT